MTNLKTAAKRAARSIAATALLALAALPLPTYAGLNTSAGGWVAGMVSSGSEPFDSLDPAAGDANVRTHDSVFYRVGFTTVNGSDTHAYITLHAGSHSLPSSYTGPSLSEAGRFDVLDMPTSCLNISQAAVSSPPTNGVSGVTADGQTVFCAQPSPTNGNNLDFRFRISGKLPNNTTLTAPRISYRSDQTPENDSPQTLDGLYGTETFFAFPELTIRAEPRWNLRVKYNRGGAYVPASGPAGEDGFVFSWSLGVMGLGSRKGLEALQPPFDINVDFSDSDFPNARLIDWDMQNPGYVSANFSGSGTKPHHGCGNWYNQLTVSGNFFDNRYHKPNDIGHAGFDRALEVANGGDCRVNTVSNASKTAVLSIDDTDFSLQHWPSKHGSNPAARALVNISNANDSNNEWWVANKSVLVWVPVTDISVNSSEFFTLEAQLSGTSISGQSNHEADSADNSATPGATRRMSGSLHEVHTPPVWSNPYGMDYTVRDPVITGDGHVNQVAPNQVLALRIGAYNHSTSALPAGYICDRVDNTRLKLFDARDTAYTSSSANEKDPLTGVFVNNLSGPEIPLTWELGVASPWSNYNTAPSEYDRPLRSGSAQSDSGCEDSDAAWYSSIDTLLAAEGPDALQRVTHVRGSYDSYPAGSRLLIYIPQQANSTFAYSGTDNASGTAPGGSFRAGDNTAGSMAVHQASWNTNEPAIFSGGIGKAADATRIFQTEYARVSKQSTTHQPSGSLARVGDVITYALTVNLSSSGSTHTSDATVWEVLPKNLNYIPGSTRLGGIAIADPLCRSTGLPPGLFPGTDGAPAGSIADDYKACVWQLNQQLVKKAAIGHVTANIPALEYKAVLSFDTPSATPLLTSSAVTSAQNLLSLPVYAGNEEGWTCLPRRSCSFSHWLVNSQATPGIVLNKEVSQTVFSPEGTLDYTLSYGAIGQSLSNTRIIDIFPHNSDARTPSSAYSGRLKLRKAIVAPTENPRIGTHADTNFIVLYSAQSPSDISSDPYAASHHISGLARNTATSSNWCAKLQFGLAHCPATVADATAAMLLPDGYSSTPSLQEGRSYRVSMHFKTEGNRFDDVYSNHFTADSPSLTARRPSSNTVSSSVKSPDLLIHKTATPDTADAGAEIVFEIAVKNNDDSNTSPLYTTHAPKIRVVDTLPSGLTLLTETPVATDWDCSASHDNTVDCSYTGSLPISIGAPVGSPIILTAKLSDTATDGTWIKNTASVSLSGQAEADTDNNTSEAWVRVQRAVDLTLSKSADKSTAAQTDTVTYTLSARVDTEGGRATAGPITVSDPLPVGLRINSATDVNGTDWDCSASIPPAAVQCTYTGPYPVTPNNPIGSDIHVHTTVNTDAATGDIHNSASVFIAGEKDTDNNSGTHVLRITDALADISGTVYFDTANNAILDRSDTPLEAVNITLCRAAESPCTPANTVDSTSTGATGTYRFESVPQGSFYVVQDQPTGFGSSTDNIVNVTRTGAVATSSVDFGETQGKLSGYVYADMDKDGVRSNSGENGVGVAMEIVLQGVSVDYTNGQDMPVEIRVPVDPTTGAYAIENIPVPKLGTGYTLTQTPGIAPGFANANSHVGSLNATSSTALNHAGDADSAASRIVNIRFVVGSPAAEPSINGKDYNFGETPQASISGRVYLDTDGSGNHSTADTGMANISVLLCRSNTQPCPTTSHVETVQTAPDGGYLFNNVAVGRYFVQQLQPLGYGSVTPNILAVTRTGSQPVAEINFGERGATLAGQVFIDEDRSSSHSTADTHYTQGSATIELVGITAEGIPLEMTQSTDSTGRYQFKDLPAPNNRGYALSIDAQSIASPYYAARAHLGSMDHAGGTHGNYETEAPLSSSGLTWPVSNTPTRGPVALGSDYNFSLLQGVTVSGRVMRDTYASGSGNTSIDPNDRPQQGVNISLCRSESNPCPTADTVAITSTDAQGDYRFSDVVAGSYWVVEEQPTALGNGPGATDIIAAEVTTEALEHLDFLDRAGVLSGTVFRDNNADEIHDGEPGIEGVVLTLTGHDINGNPVDRAVQTDTNGRYQLNDLPAANASGYTLTESQEPADTHDGRAFSGELHSATGTVLGQSGTALDADTLSAISLTPGSTGTVFNFSELPATSSVSGTVWRDRDSDRTYSTDEDAVAGWVVQLLRIDATGDSAALVEEQVTGQNGKYDFTGQTPGDYRIVFRSPATNGLGEHAIWGTPINGEQGAPVNNSNAEISGGIIRRITLKADDHITQQSLPLDPSGVVYNAIDRIAVPGAVVTLAGPAGFTPDAHLLGGAAAASLTTALTGEYQFLLLANAPAGEYSLDVQPPAGYDYASTIIPPEQGVLTPPNGAANLFPVVPSERAPVAGAPTTYYTHFNLTPGVSSGVVHNHIPLDPHIAPVLFVSKQSDRSTVELGDSVKYTVRMHNRGTAVAPALAIEDQLPLGFKYIHGTAKVSTEGLEATPLADPIRLPGTTLLFDLPGTLAAGEALQLSYRVRAGVGADRGDGINRATGISGSLRSRVAQARVQVHGGVFSDESCLTGRVYVDCNNNHMQDGEELGIPGVRFYMEDGRYLVSDVEGKYSSCDLSPQTHILKADPMTLPRGSRLVTSSNRNAGDASSLFLNMSKGELHRADFIEGSCTSMVLEQVRARRSHGEVLQAQTEAYGAASLSLKSHAMGVNRGTVSADQALVRRRPAQTADGLLSDTQDTPQSEQNIQSGAPFARMTPSTMHPDLHWDDSKLKSLEIQFSEATAPADGISAVQITALLRDTNGKRLRGRQLVTLVADGGHLWLDGQTTDEQQARAADLDPTTPGVQAWARDGHISLSLLAPEQAKTVTVQVIASGYRASSKIEFIPALREWIAAGLVEGIIRLNDKGGFNAGTHGNGLFERELQQWQHSFNRGKGSAAARVAFFVKGTVKGKYLLTASYDSEKEESSRILQDIKPEQLYPVFGDASIKGFEAQSSHKLFVRIAHDKHFLLYGDFQSDNGNADLGANNRTLTGARLHLEDDRGLLDAYASNDSLRHKVENLTPNGTSGPYGIRGLAVDNTERVELLTRDRNLRSQIIEQRQLVRLIDYSFDPFTGRLLFKSPISRTDDNGNPQTIRVSYEQDGNGSSSWSAGLRAELQVNDSLRIGTSYSSAEREESTEDQLSELISIDAEVAVNEWLTVRAETAHSVMQAANGSGESSGNATKVAISSQSKSGSWSAALHAVQSDVDFHNRNASAEQGRGEIGLRLKAAISETLSARSDIQRSTDDTTGAQIDSTYVGLKLRPREGFAVAAGLRHLRDNGRGLINSAEIESNGSVYNGSGLNNAGAGLFSNGETLTSSVDGDSLKTNTLLLGADWAITEKLSLGAEVENSFAGDDSWRASAKAGWAINSHQTLQARYETQTGLGSDIDRRQKSRSFVFGLSNNFDDDGNHFTELRLRDAIGGREAHLAYGIRNGFNLGSGLRGIASAEQVAILDGEGRTATSGSLGVSYLGGHHWKGSARVEARRLHDNRSTAEDDSADSWLANLSIARKLDRSWTALLKYISLGSDDKSQEGEQHQRRIQVGAAYRPVDNNQLSVLTKLEHRRERNSELSTAESRDLWVASVNSNWHPSRTWQLGARLAAKEVDESLEGVQDNYRASLLGGRATYDITERTDTGVMASYRYSPDGHTRDWATGLEMGYAVQSNLRLSVGHNWGGFSDRDLSGADYTQRGWYIRLGYKFDEDIFNGASASVNRSRPRSANQQESKQ